MVHSDDASYNDHIIATYELDDSYDLKNEKSKLFSYRPKISILTPVFNTDENWLRLAIESVINQIYDNWELCIADGGSTKPYIKVVLEEYAKKDNRIKVRFLNENKGIAGNSNEALSLATGEFVGFLDHDDELHPDALYEVISLLNADNNIDFIYSDEDKITQDGRRFEPHFKPDWAPDTFRSYNYICHFTVIRKTVVDEIGGFREGFDGSQDYDLFLRTIEKTQRIKHIPKVLYHWRSHDLSVASDPKAKIYAYDSAKRALSEHLRRTGLNGNVQDGFFTWNRITYHIEATPSVTIIIPTKDKVKILKKCIDSIINKTTYANYKIIIVDNQGVEAGTFGYYEEINVNSKIEIIKYDMPFNYSAVNNYAVSHANSEYLIFLNNDTEVITPKWIEGMLEFAQRDDVGAVGCLLLYPDDTVQHGGVIVGFGGIAGHAFHRLSKDSPGYMGRLQIIQNLSAVTGACLMTKKSIFQEVGGLDERLSHAFNDIDLCLKIREHSYLIVYTPYTQLYHHESLSRGYEDTIEKQLRFGKETKFFSKRWEDLLKKGDPYYNPNLSYNRGDFSVKDVSELLGFNSLNKALLEKDVHISNLVAHADNLERYIKDKNVHILNLETHAGNLERAIKAKDTHISNLETHISNLETHAGNLERAVKTKDVHILNLETHIKDLEKSVTDNDNHVSNLETMIKDKEVALNNIYKSTGWKILLILYKVRDIFLPLNTGRRLFIKNLLNIIRK